MYSSKHLVTPAFASSLLAKNDNNRNISSPRVELYARQMLNGNWALTHQGIAISKSGKLIDGQHRLAAVVKANVPVEMMVFSGLDDESIFAIDQSRPRSKFDAIKIGGLCSWANTKTVEVANTIFGMFFNTKIATPSEIASYIERNKEAFLFIQDVFSGNKRGIASAGVRSAVFCAYYYLDKNKLSNFVKILHSGVVESSNQAHIVRLRDILTDPNSGGRARIAYFTNITMRSIMAYCNDEKLLKLREASDFIYMPPTTGKMGK
jgi:hypothetical protein